MSRAGALGAAYDPVAMPNARAAVGDLPRLTWAESAAESLRNLDVLLLVTEWPEFAHFDPHAAATALGRRAGDDGRKALEATAWSQAGVRVTQIGRSSHRRTE